MALESEQYRNRVATVVGGNGQLGSRIVKGLEGLGLRQVRVCERGEPFRDFLTDSTDIFFAVDADNVLEMLQVSRDLLRPEHSILDGVSVKTNLINPYRELDHFGVSVCSTHLGSVPTHPWRGVKVWLCEVGPNSERAKRLAVDLFIEKNTSIQTIDISEHSKVERDQWFNFAVMLLFATALRNGNLTLVEFDKFATLNSELGMLPLARSLGQNPRIISEILNTQPKRQIFLDHLRNANMRMYSLSLRIIDDRSGRLRDLLDPFYEEGINLTAIDSMPGIITTEEETRGVDPEGIVECPLQRGPITIVK